MKEKINHFIHSVSSVISSIAFSLQISWKASKAITIIRMGMTLLGAFIPLAQVWLAKKIIDVLSDSIGKTDSESYIRKFIFYCIFLLVIQIVSKIITVLQEITGEVQKDAINEKIDCTVMEKVEELDISYYDSRWFYHCLNIAKRDASCLPDLVWCTADAIKQGINIGVSLTVAASLHWILPVIIIAVCVPSFYAKMKYNLFYYRYGCITSNKELKYAYIFKMFTEKAFAKEIKLYETKDYLLDRYQSLWNEVYKGRRKIIAKFGKRSAITKTFPEIVKIGIQFLAAVKVLLKKGTLGDYTFYLGMVSNAVSSMGAFLESIAKILDLNTRIINYKKFLAMKSLLNECGNKQLDGIPSIEFKNVSFTYRTKIPNYILKNINFKINPGDKIAFVGLNGAGKTTLIKLIMRFYEPTEGCILLNGIDIHEYDKDVVRNLFSSVFQDYAQFAFKVKECVAMSEIERIDDLEKVKEACTKSGADQFIKEWKDGYNTYLTKTFEKSGQELSGGQWQKVALASAFFKNSKVLILDEPTASLDPIAEYEIFEKFATLSHGKSAVLISHRLSSVTMVDTIFVLENGTIVENGTHEELIQKNGVYYQLFQLQAEKYVANV